MKVLLLAGSGTTSILR
ncbi:hypothetical protein AZE42_13009 [Rhizopogon vesiculosus]|uniref:Uncharacterized protein n=1 Tax=Rhizopogon vesiculosus TaxID=180088 RepID=A0A1J8Q8G6_9AGAM|nr:hypothetical protein AZE42_13009 [Rhizopogon vesiculosus]